MDLEKKRVLVQLVERCIGKCSGTDGWVLLSALGSALKIEDPDFSPNAYGEEKLVTLLAKIRDVVEIQSDESKSPPVLLARLCRSEPRDTASDARRSHTATIARNRQMRFLDWAYIPDVPRAVSALQEMALEERWSFATHNDQGYPHPILWNYLRYTFVRLNRENKLKESDDVASLNTGLVDRRYEPIHAFFRKNPNRGRQKWVLSSFCVAGEGYDGKDLVRTFRPLPQPAHYFSNVEDMIYDARAGKPEVDWEHVLIENISRLPKELLEEQAPPGFDFLNPDDLTPPERQTFFTELGESVRRDGKAYRGLKSRFVEALDLAIKRTRWNFKTAIPQYFPRRNSMSLLLPLALLSEDQVDLALVVEKTQSGSYLGHTIFPLDWAYMNARLVCRPDSDWLIPGSIVSNEEDDREFEDARSDE